SGRSVRLFRGHDHPIRGLAFSPDARRLATVDEDRVGSIRIWEVENGSVVLSLHGRAADGTKGIAFSPDGGSVVTASEDCGEVWDARTGQHLRSFAEHDWAIHCVAYSRDGRWIATGSRDGAVKVGEASTGRLLRTVNEKAGRTSAVAFSPDDQDLA